MKDQPSSELTPLQIAECKTGKRLGSLLRAKGASNRLRIKADGVSACYHVMSRTAGGEYLLDDEAKEAFCRMMWRMAKFTGVEILTYCIMDNHFHLLVKVPEKEKWLQRFEGEGGEEKLLRHLACVYSKDFMRQLRNELAAFRERGQEHLAEQLIQSFKDRLCDLSKFVKELKERFSRWYNKQRGRRGTLWMDRFKSVLVQGRVTGEGRRQGVCDPTDTEDVALMMANYIDLNPVRAGICEDPKDYRWCGYAEAVAGEQRARRGLCKVLGIPLNDWLRSQTQVRPGCELYRMSLMGKSGEKRDFQSGKVIRKGLTRKKAQKIVEEGGKLSRLELLRCKLRYFTESQVLGSQGFVKEFFSEKKRDSEKGSFTPGQNVELIEKELKSLRAIRSRLLE